MTLQFDLSRNIDGAARDVEAAINAARAYLPSNLPSNPSYHKVNPANAPIMILALTSDIYDRGQMYDAATNVLSQRLRQLEADEAASRRQAQGPRRPGLSPNRSRSCALRLSHVSYTHSLVAGSVSSSPPPRGCWLGSRR